MGRVCVNVPGTRQTASQRRCRRHLPPSEGGQAPFLPDAQRPPPWALSDPNLSRRPGSGLCFASLLTRDVELPLADGAHLCVYGSACVFPRSYWIVLLFSWKRSSRFHRHNLSRVRIFSYSVFLVPC